MIKVREPGRAIIFAVGLVALAAILLSAVITHVLTRHREPTEVRVFCEEQCRAFDGWLLEIEIRPMLNAPPEYVCSCALDPDLD